MHSEYFGEGYHGIIRKMLTRNPIPVALAPGVCQSYRKQRSVYFGRQVGSDKGLYVFGKNGRVVTQGKEA